MPRVTQLISSGGRIPTKDLSLPSTWLAGSVLCGKKGRPCTQLFCLQSQLLPPGKRPLLQPMHEGLRAWGITRMAVELLIKKQKPIWVTG